MNGKRFSENKARRNGFYLALAVCLVAVGVAAWSTFDAVQGYMSSEPVQSAMTPRSTAAPGPARPRPTRERKPPPQPPRPGRP